MSVDLDFTLKKAIQAAQMGGKILKEEFGMLKPSQINLKGLGDYVTELDHRSEQIIIKKIKETFPDHIIYAEESGEEGEGSAYRWIIDPLDGTTNYVQGIPFYAISIALVVEDVIQLGVVYSPEHEELFHSIRSRGAYLNNQRIFVSKKEILEGCVLATGFPWRSKMYIDAYLSTFRELFQKVDGIRRFGSAAMDLCYTACGRYDGFWEMKLKPWDIAAGVLIVQEAGGVVTDFQGKYQYMESGNVVASNGRIQEQLIQHIYDPSLSC